LGEVCQANDQDIEAAVNSSEKAFHIWNTKTGAERGRVLLKAAHILRSRLEKIAFLETQDVGKPISESLAVDIRSLQMPWNILEEWLQLYMVSFLI
jgi:NAD-dependent aldehyde dehydrogenases